MEKNIHDIAVFLDSNLNFTIKLFACGLANDNMSIKKKNLQIISQGCREGTSIVAFEVLIINCQIYFINLFIFNCLTLNIKLFIFKLFDVKFLFSENHAFRKQKRTAVYGVMDARPYILILNSLGKMMTCYLQEINKFLRYRTLCKSIPKCGFPTKVIELRRFVLFEILRVLQLWDTCFRPFRYVRYENLRNTSETME